jgi:hypothetical protein
MSTALVPWKQLPHPMQQLAAMGGALSVGLAPCELASGLEFPRQHNQTSVASLTGYCQQIDPQYRQLAGRAVAAMLIAGMPETGTGDFTYQINDLGATTGAPLATFSPPSNYRVADFYDPVVFGWQDGEAEIIDAVREDCETFYGNRRSDR